MKALAEQLLARHGVLTRDAVVHEEVTGGFSAIYPVLRALEEAGRIRRGYFVAGRGGLQFALPGALDRLRTRQSADGADAPPVVLPAADPANPYGAALPWPRVKMSGTRLQRAAGSHVVLVEGRLGTYVSRNGRDVFPLLPDEEPLRSHVARGVAQALARWAEASGRPTLGWASGRGAGLAEGPLGRHLAEVGFVRSGPGFRLEGTNGLPAPQGRPGR
jgi:ATP-dependent Lhr-like helicase